MIRIKIIILCCVFFMISCRKIDLPTPIDSISKDFFSVSENGVKNGDVINFTLKTSGI